MVTGGGVITPIPPHRRQVVGSALPRSHPQTGSPVLLPPGSALLCFPEPALLSVAASEGQDSSPVFMTLWAAFPTSEVGRGREWRASPLPLAIAQQTSEKITSLTLMPLGPAHPYLHHHSQPHCAAWARCRAGSPECSSAYKCHIQQGVGPVLQSLWTSMGPGISPCSPPLSLQLHLNS